MNPVTIIPEQQGIFKRLQKLHEAGFLAHAYLFTGALGSGKLHIALELAKLVNCLAPQYVFGCTCVSCVKIDNEQHPDVLVVSQAEDKTVITAAQMRVLIDRFELRAFEGKVKVAIIQGAEHLSLDAANIFLKTLEEPGGEALFILTACVPERILGTIFSRCHEVRFFPLSNARLAEVLENEYDVPFSEAEILAKFSEGSLGRAVEDSNGFLKRKNRILDDFVFGPAQEALFKKYTADKDITSELCRVLLVFFRDVLIVRVNGSREVLVHQDRLKDIETLAQQYSKEDLDDIFLGLVKLQEAVDQSFNVKIALIILKELL